MRRPTSDVSNIFEDVIAQLKAVAGEGGVVTDEDVERAIEHLPSEPIDIEALDLAIQRAGLVWEFQRAGPPTFPPGYVGLKLVKNGSDPAGS